MHRLIHALLLGYLEDHVLFQQLLNSFLVCVPVLVQEERRSEAVARGSRWTGSNPQAPALVPPQDEGMPCTWLTSQKIQLQGNLSNTGPAELRPLRDTLPQ